VGSYQEPKAHRSLQALCQDGWFHSCDCPAVFLQGYRSARCRLFEAAVARDGHPYWIDDESHTILPMLSSFVGSKLIFLKFEKKIITKKSPLTKSLNPWIVNLDENSHLNLLSACPVDSVPRSLRSSMYEFCARYSTMELSTSFLKYQSLDCSLEKYEPLDVVPPTFI
jgi:hypothetical protein